MTGAGEAADPGHLAARGGARLLSSQHMVIGALVGAFLACWAGLMSLRLTTNASDAALYFRYGELIRHGLVPYRDFTLEYPPASTVVFALPALFASCARGY